MKRVSGQFRLSLPGLASLLIAALAIWMLVGIGPDGGRANASGTGSGSGSDRNAGTGTTMGEDIASPSVTCPGGQCFTDVTSSNTFYTFINSLYLDNIIGGYPCGGTGEPCDSQHRPYYRPNNNVSRGQMAKFVDNGRRNIADAVGHSLILSNPVGNALTINGTAYISNTVGHSLYISNTAYIGDALGHSLYISTTAGLAVDAETRSGGEAVYAECLQAGNNCYALEGYASTGDYAGYMYGGKGVYAESDDASQPGLDVHAYGSGAYGVEARSAAYRGEYVNSTTAGFISLYVDRADAGATDLYVNSGAEINGNLIVDGSKTGYVVDVMQNAGSAALAPGDVVVMVGNGPPVVGQIPVVVVQKAANAYDTAVAGVVDQVLYVPDAATKAAYQAQEADIRAAMQQRDAAQAAARAVGTKPSDIPLPPARISDDEGTLHALSEATSAAPGTYVNVVTLGSYKQIKVDASFSPIHVGDLLTTSPNPGFAMKVTDKTQAFGAVIGKALADLDSGTGTIPVMVKLK